MFINNNRRAATLAMTIIAATIFLGFIMSALFKVAISASHFNDEALNDTQAKFAALAGINRAFAELEKNPDWRKGFPDETPLHQNPNLRYKLKVLEEVEQFRLGGLGTGKVASGAEEVYLFAQGFTDEGAGDALAAMGGTAYRPGAAIAEACFADGDLILNGGTVDGFDSRKGEHWYNPGQTDTTKQTLVALSGHVGGNDDIMINGSTIDGDVITPDPGSFSLGGQNFGRNSNVEINGATINGTQQSPDSPREVAEVVAPFDDDSATAVYNDSNFSSLLDSTVVPPPGEDPAKVLPPGAYESVTVPLGKTMELKSGVYYFKDHLALEGATITLNGSKIKVFIGEDLYVKDSTISPSQVDTNNKNKKPADLQILFADKKEDPDTGEKFSVMYSDNSTINAVCLGSNLQSRLNNSTLFGAVQADRIEADNTNFHYDLALEDLEISNFSKWKLKGLTTLPPGTNL